MDREQLHQLLMTLRNEIASGRVIVRSESTIAALEKVRYGPDGKVDPSTVDGSIRALGLAAVTSVSRKRAKEISLREVQSAYFELLEGLFGDWVNRGNSR